MGKQDSKGTALITGASSGIGAVYADRLARRGYDLILVARNRARLESLAERLARESGRHIEILLADLTATPDLRRVEERLRHDGAITLLVNNAGLGATAPLLDSDPDQIDTMIQLNVVALTRLTHAVAPGFVARGGGTVVELGALSREASPMNDSSHKNAVSEAAQRLIGTWRLVAFTQNGQPHPVYGRRPSGLIRYDESGAMAVQIMPERALPPSSTPDATPTIPGYIAYFGRYSVDERAKTVAHHRLGNVTPGEPATVVRHYELSSDDRLALILGEDATSQVLWQRVREKRPSEKCIALKQEFTDEHDRRNH